MQDRIASYRLRYETGELTLKQIAAEVPCPLGYLRWLHKQWGWKKQEPPVACLYPQKPAVRPQGELDRKMARVKPLYGTVGIYDLADRIGVDVEVLKDYITDNRWEPTQANRTTNTSTGRIHRAD